MMRTEGSATIYELWNTPSRNLIAEFDSRSDTLAAIRAFIEDDGADSIDGVALIRQEPDRSGGVIAFDVALARVGARRA
jgi:hypothetical protein